MRLRERSQGHARERPAWTIMCNAGWRWIRAEASSAKPAGWLHAADPSSGKELDRVAVNWDGRSIGECRRWRRNRVDVPPGKPSRSLTMRTDGQTSQRLHPKSRPLVGSFGRAL